MLGELIEQIDAGTGLTPEPGYVDKGYAGGDYPNRSGIYHTGPKRGTTPTIGEDKRRHSAIEGVIGHIKTDSALDRNFLQGHDGDRINPILIEDGYDHRLVLKWPRPLCARVLARLERAFRTRLPLQYVFTRPNGFFPNHDKTFAIHHQPNTI